MTFSSTNCYGSFLFFNDLLYLSYLGLYPKCPSLFSTTLANAWIILFKRVTSYITWVSFFKSKGFSL